jgi:hypothetical protein
MVQDDGEKLLKESCYDRIVLPAAKESQLTVSTSRGHVGPGNEQFRHDLPRMASGIRVADAQSRTSGNCSSGKTLALGGTQEGNVSSIIVWRYSFATLFCFFALIGMPPANVDGTTRQEASPEMDRLKKLYLGSWDYTETYSKTPFYPQGGSDTGVYTSEPGPGGNSIVNRFHSHGAVGDFEGLLVITWDPKEKAYKSYVFGNECANGPIRRRWVGISF